MDEWIRRKCEPLRESILELRTKGLSQSRVAKELGITQHYLSVYLRSLGQEGRVYPLSTGFSPLQQSVLIGTLLGDGCLRRGGRSKNPNLQWSHGESQRDFLIWKAQIFGELFTSLVPRAWLKPDGRLCLQLSSRNHPVFDEYERIVYSRPHEECNEHLLRKKITPQVLARLGLKGGLDYQALAIWFADDGSVEKGENAWGDRLSYYLHLGAGLWEEYELVATWFARMGFSITRSPKESWDKRPYPIPNSVKLRFSAENSLFLSMKFKELLPVCIWEKLGLHPPSPLPPTP
jgi:hypothetical protein